MRSIRRALVIYFLVLLTIGLLAISGFVYRVTAAALEAKKVSTQALLSSQYDERVRQINLKFDEELLAQARALAGLAQAQYQYRRMRMLPYTPLGLISASIAPQSHFTTYAWVAQAFKSPLSSTMWKRFAHEIQFNEDELPHEGSIPDYFQVNSEWGSSWRSKSLGKNWLPFDSNLFSTLNVFAWSFENITIFDGSTVRSVNLRAPITRFRATWPIPPRSIIPPPQPLRFPTIKKDKDQPPFDGTFPPKGGVKGQGSRDLFPEQTIESATQTIIVQCASRTDERDAMLAELHQAHAHELDALEAQTQDTLNQLQLRLSFVAGLTFIGALFGGLVLVWIGLAPLRRVSDAVSQVSEKDFQIPLDKSQLPIELVPIVERLQQSLNQLRDAFAREKQATADISHELRTPLAALLTMIDVSLRKTRTPEEYRATLEDCKTTGKQLSRLVDRILTLARLDAGGTVLQPERGNLAEVVQECVMMIRPLAESAGLQLIYHEPASQVPIVTDFEKLREVLNNLLHNAISYNKPGGQVAVSIRRDQSLQHMVEVEVKDTGIGIPPHLQSKIFERFFRADPSRHMTGVHAGLGLAIVREYVQRMGGSIHLQSEPDVGSAFRIRLPANA
jgi:signal transduction histidine kinase